MPNPSLSLILLTWNEEKNVEACLAALARQSVGGFEVVVVDAGSTDRTVALVEAMRPSLPFFIRLHVGEARMPIGQARNLGVALARAPLAGFVSADAELEPGWVGEAMTALRSADMAFGPQIHSPVAWTLGAAVRGLRYHFPAGPTRDPVRFASNVAAAYRKEVLERFPFDPAANAAEDVLLATRATSAGYVAHYEPRMVVRHRDVASLRQEMRKNLREGQGCGQHVRELGLQWPVVAWLALLGIAVLAMTMDAWAGGGLLAGALWLPALRRGLRRRRAMPLRRILAGIAASPVFDVAFLLQYLHGLLRSFWYRPPQSFREAAG